MEIETSIISENVNRKQRTGADLFGPTNALVIPDVVSGSAFGAVGLRVKRISPMSTDPEEYILSEYDPQSRERLKALYMRREALRAQLHQLGSQLSKERYHRLVEEFTSGYRVIKVVKGWREMTAYEWSIETGHWKTIQDEERVTRTEFYERLLKYAHLSPQARKSAYQSLRQSRLADKVADKYGLDVAKSHVWRTNPRTIRVRNIPLYDGSGKAIPKGANLHDIKMNPIPVYGPKRVPITDWDAIRYRWSKLVEAIQPQQEALLSELQDVERQLLIERPSSSHKFNQCVQVSAAPNPAKSRSVRLLAHWDSLSFPNLIFEGPDSRQVHPVLPGDPTTRLVWSSAEHVYIAPQTVANRKELDQLIAGMVQECVDWSSTGVYPEIPDDWEDIGSRKAYLSGVVSANLSIADPTEPVYYFENEPGIEPNVPLPLRSRFVGEHVGDAISVDTESRADAVDEKIQSSLNALLAGRASGSDDVSFNFTRSMGELKDLPRTGSQSSNFASWLLSPDAREELYAFKVKGHKKPLYAPLRYLDKKTNLLFGIKTASYRAVKRTPTIAMLASAYLGWKFAIEPTTADISRLQRELFSDLIASRRYVTRLYRKLDTTTTAVVLRKGFLVGTPVKRDKPLEIAQLERIRRDIPFRDALSFTQAQLIAAMNCDATPFLVAELEDKTSGDRITVPYVLTRQGLRFYLWFKTDGSSLTNDERRRCMEDSYERAAKLLPVELYANPCLYHSWVKGCVFARYGRNALANLANDRSLAQKLDRLKIVKTAWDLSPLSFLLEWFTNLGDIVQNAQDILSTDTVGIMPIGDPWVRATERFAITQISAPQQWTLTQRTIRASYRPILTAKQRGTSPRGFIYARVDLFPTYLEWEWSVVDKATGQLVNRRKWLDELQPLLKKSRAAVTNRRPCEWKRELPSLRPQLRLDYGKGLTLLAMYLSGLRR